MKKLSVLIALMLIVTITGVYAVWSYAGTNDIADAFAESKITIADVELTGANGVYTIESNLVLTVDQANDKHEAKLVFSANDGNPVHMTVTFKPATNAPAAIKENAVPSELYFGTTAPMQYKIDAQGNYSATGTRRVDINVTASYDADPDKVVAALLEAAKDDRVLADPAPFAGLTGYGESAISYTVRVWVKTEDYWDVYNKINRQVLDTFRENGIEMTYPHLNVHLDK